MNRWIAILALGCALAWQPPSGAYAQDKQQPTAADKPPAVPVSPADTVPAPIQVPQPVQPPQPTKYEVDCDQAKDADEAALCDQMEATAAANRTVIQGWVNLAFVFAGFIAVAYSLFLTRVATKTAVQANADADKVMAMTAENVDAMTKSAEATASLAAVTEQTARIELRAYIACTQCIFATDGHDHGQGNAEHKGTYWRLQLTWENSGRTPTRDLSMYLTFMIDLEIDPAAPEPPTFPPPERFAKPIRDVLGPGGKRVMSTGYLAPKIMIDLANGRPFYVFGVARYRDIYGEKHVTMVCKRMFIERGPDWRKLRLGERTTGADETMARWNGADEECGRYAQELANVPSLPEG
jgi:hypothetical protein